MSHTISQKALILVHLRYGDGLQPLEALNKYGCNRLAARIRDLRRDGWDITTKIVTTPSGKRVARYSLTDPAQKEPTGVPIPGRNAGDKYAAILHQIEHMKAGPDWKSGALWAIAEMRKKK
jgi:hypothetical protein